jgi:hypothetical protein
VCRKGQWLRLHAAINASRLAVLSIVTMENIDAVVYARCLRTELPGCKQSRRSTHSVRAAPQSELVLVFIFVLDTLALGSCFSLALLIAGLLVVLVLAGFLENTCLLDLLLETLKSAIERFIRTNLYLRQPYSPTLRTNGIKSYRSLA